MLATLLFVTHLLVKMRIRVACAYVGLVALCGLLSGIVPFCYVWVSIRTIVKEGNGN